MCDGMCLDEFASACHGRELDRQSQHIMAETGESVETAATLKDCIQLCYDAPKVLAFTCLSLMYFPLVFWHD